MTQELSFRFYTPTDPLGFLVSSYTLASDEVVAVAAVLDGKLVGRLSATETNTVCHVFVNEEHRRKGVATALFNQMQDHLGSLTHSEKLSPDGAAWKAAIG